MQNKLDDFIELLNNHEAYLKGQRHLAANLLCLTDVSISDFSFNENANLSRASFLNCVFDTVDFSGVNLSLTRFYSCSFKNVLFVRPKMDRVVFPKCNFQNTFFKQCGLDGVSFYKSDLSNVDLSSLRAIESDFSMARLNTTIFKSNIDSCFFIKSQLSDRGNKIFELEDVAFLDPIGRYGRENYFDSFYLPMALIHLGHELMPLYYSIWLPWDIKGYEVKGRDKTVVDNHISTYTYLKKEAENVIPTQSSSNSTPLGESNPEVLSQNFTQYLSPPTKGLLNSSKTNLVSCDGEKAVFQMPEKFKFLKAKLEAKSEEIIEALKVSGSPNLKYITIELIPNSATTLEAKVVKPEGD
jgi:uncharacterized protein YjbI with pentapeptide repeats